MLDMLDRACPVIIEQVLPHLPGSEKVLALPCLAYITCSSSGSGSGSGSSSGSGSGSGSGSSSICLLLPSHH